ncbi:SDR family oxidoreductase [Microbispora sp. CA-102843]|uniref:SDR family oxidoreductase n=1 Tax=Microbispora sp. CA-102843 TaxID=3239952 RepID=UPI003D89FD09
MTVQREGPLSGKVALVTGASEGIGRAIATRCAAEGARVVVTARRREPLAALAAELGTAVARPVVVDAGGPGVERICVEAALEHFGRLDVLVNNAAYVPPPGRLLDYDDEAVSRVWEVNVAAPLRLVRQAYRSWMSEHGGVVLNVGSLGGVSLQANMGLYNVSKAALHHLTRMLAAELGPRVRVNAIAPGLIRTPGTRAVWETAEPLMRARSPMGRLGEPDDVASLAAFLIGPESSWMTGETVNLDGGASVQLGRRSKSRRTTEEGQ